MFEFTETENSLSLDLEYDTGIFSERQSDLIQDLITQVLSLMARDDIRVSQLLSELTHDKVLFAPLTG
jgi:hypothetical protein